VSDLPVEHVVDRSGQVTVISANARKSWFDVSELIAGRDLLYYLVRRDILVRYVQTLLGLGWAVGQPLLTMVVFTIFFGRVADVSAHGAPYAVFSLAALVPWTYFTNGVNGASTSVVNNSTMLSKIYFPRIFIPLSPLLAALVDFAIALVVLGVVMAGFGLTPHLAALLLPLAILVMVLTTAGVGIWLAALASRYRDVRYVTPFFVQMLLFVSPVIYDGSTISAPARYFYALNPMVGVIEAFRAAAIGFPAFPWVSLGIGAVSSLVLLASGTRYFRSTERYFSDLA
jgi:lipopolysaccharide transport system permease protein